MGNVTYTKDYPLNLLDELAGEEWEHDLSADFEPSLAYVLATLTEREQKIIMQRYKECRTYEDISKEWNVTRERIRQLEWKAVRKMKHPTRIKYLIHGVKGQHLLEETRELQSNLSRTIAELAKAVEEITLIAGEIKEIGGMDKLMKLAADKEQYSLYITLNSPHSYASNNFI